MGKLSTDLWEREYKGNLYHGIVEVVYGELHTRSAEHKKETKIEKALAYTQVDGRKILSHISLQSYNTYLNASDRTMRDKNDEAYYPFFVEVEPETKPGQTGFVGDYRDAVLEACKLVNYLIEELDVHPEDLLITVTNSRSVYVFVNPKTFDLKPSRRLHEIYKKMFEDINETLQLKCIDHGASFRRNGLIKTPGAFYKGGYVNAIGIKELHGLASCPERKSELTKDKRKIEREMPAQSARRLKALYNRIRSNLRESSLKTSAKKGAHSAGFQNKMAYLKTDVACAKYFENNTPAKNTRNHALVSLAIIYRNAGYAFEQVVRIVQSFAEAWDHDESDKNVAAKVKAVFKNGTQFSCEFVKDNLKLPDNVCAGCRFNKCEKKGPARTGVSRDAIKLLWRRKASLKHYRAYLKLIQEDLFDEFFNPDQYDMDSRTVRELARYIEADRTLENGLVKLKMTLQGKNYVLPAEFFTKDAQSFLGESLKQYLVIYTHCAYAATGRYSKMRVAPKKLQELLGYKTVRSVYALIEKLVNLGYAVYNKGYLFALYFSSYKVVDLESVKELREEQMLLKMEFDPDEPDVVGLAIGGEIKWTRLTRGSP